MQHKLRPLLFFYVPISLALLVYTIYRASSLSLTIDEAYTFLHYVPMRFMDIISNNIVTNTVVSANNHILNTLLVKLFTCLFGTSELVLRLPSLIGHVIYLIASYLVIKKIKSPVIALLGFMLLNFNPFLLDFFSLSRGYALAAAFTFMSANFTLDFFSTKSMKAIILSLLFASLAVISNFSSLIYYVGVIMVFSFNWLIDYKVKKLSGKDLWKYLSIVLFTIALFFFLYEPIRRLIAFKTLNFGGNTGFWVDTVDSLIMFTFFGMPFGSLIIAGQVFVAAIIICSLAWVVSGLIRKKMQGERQIHLITFLLLMLPCFISVTQHILIHTKFMQDRMGLFLIPLFVVNLLFLADTFSISPLRKWIGISMLGILAITFVYHTINTENNTYTLLWWYDAQSKDVIKDMETYHAISNKDINLGVNDFYSPSCTYYKMRKNLTWLTITNMTYAAQNCDYYYMLPWDDDEVNKKPRIIITQYETSKAYLVK